MMLENYFNINILKRIGQYVSDAVATSLISGIASCFCSIVAAYFAFRAKVHSEAAVVIAKHTEENTNHMKDELVAITRTAAHAEGVIEGKSIITGAMTVLTDPQNKGE